MRERISKKEAENIKSTVIALHKAGWPPKKIGEDIGIKPTRAYQIIKRAGYQPHKQEHRAGKNARSLEGWGGWAAMKLYRKGYSMRLIGRITGIDHMTIWNYLKAIGLDTSKKRMKVTEHTITPEQLEKELKKYGPKGPRSINGENDL